LKNSYKLLKRKNLDNFKASVMAAPLTATLNSKAKAFKYYKSGVIDTMEACPIGYSHAVNIVGYGHDDKQDVDYWLIRNSWGTKWGEDGYAKIAIVDDSQEDGKGVCGIHMFVTRIETTDF
jgi:C1A family cysteine protease